MNKWVKIGGALLLLAWAPFLYAELSSDGPEQPERALPSEKVHDEPTDVQPVEPAHEEEAKAEQEAPAAADPNAPAAAPAADPNAPAANPNAPAAAGPGTGADQVAQLAAQPGQAAPAAPGATDPKADPNAAEPPEGSDELAAAEGEEEEPEPTPPTTSGPAEALKQAYEQQPRDALWAADAEAKIRALYAGDDIPDGLLHAASCRKAVCRVELRWTSAHAAAYVSTYEAAQKLLGGEVGVEPVGTPTEQGEQSVNLYLTRKGYTLADLSR